MRILHISDIHWRGLARHDEYTQAFEKLFEMAKEIKPDIIINTGDTFHTKTQGITPEIIDRLSWMFRSLADIAPSYTILGNHDGALTNPERQDAISPIHDAINHPNSFLLKNSGYYDIDDKFCLSVFSPFDKDPWPTLRPQEGKVNIALFHGAISHCRFGNGHILEKGEKDIAYFEGYDIALLGDIHDMQFLAHRPNGEGKLKPWIGYPGSLIQQNFGESQTKGFFVWDIEDRENWDVEYHELPNFRPFHTVEWQGDPESTIVSIKEWARNKYSGEIPVGSRFRVTHKEAISEPHKKELISLLHDEHKAETVTFSPIAESMVSDDIILENSLSALSKKSLRNDPEALYGLYKDYVMAEGSKITLDEEQLKVAKEYLSGYISRLNSEVKEQSSASAWEIKYLKFDNLYGYGEGNYINFENLNGIVGILGKNKIGKSSIIGAIMYALFNTTDRGPINGTYIINREKDWAMAEISFTSGGKTYVIERTTERIRKGGIDTGKVSNNVNLYELVGDTKVSLNGEAITDTDKNIRAIIGTSDDFLLTSLAAQGDLFKFIREGSTNRKKHLSRFLELNLFEKIHAYAKEEAASINISKDLLTEDEWNSKAAQVEKQIQTTEKKIAANDKKKATLESKREKLQEWISKYENNSSRADHITYRDVIEETEALVADLDIKKEQRVKYRADIKTLKREIASLEKHLERQDRAFLESKISSLRSFQTTMKDLGHLLDKEKSKLSNQEKSVKKLSTVPCGDSFPDCRFIKDSHEDKSKMEAQQKIVEKLTGEYQDISESVDNLLQNKYEEELQALASTEEEHRTKKQRCHHYMERVLRLDAEIVNLEGRLGELKEKGKILKEQLDSKQEEEYSNKKKALNDIHNEHASLERERIEYYQLIGRKQKELETILEEKERSKDATNRYSICSSIQKAFHKNAIPAIILRTQIPAINAEISRILQATTDIKVTLEADDNSMDVYLEDEESGKRIIEICSGMEKTLCSYVLRVALNNISSISKSNIFILDEGFGALDEENQQAALEMLGLFKDYFKTVLVISHENPIKESVERIIEVERGEDGAHVNVA